MSNVNIVIMEGRLTHDPELTVTKNGKTLCRFSLANNRYYYKDRTFHDSVGFFKIVTWGTLAQRCADYLKKGRLVLINGELRQDSYVGRDGQKRQSIYINAREVKFLERKHNGGGQGVRQNPVLSDSVVMTSEPEAGVIPDTMPVEF